MLSQRFQTIQGALQGQQDSTATGKEEGAAGEGWGAPLQTVLGGRTLQCSVGVTLLPLQESAVGVQDAQV